MANTVLNADCSAITLPTATQLSSMIAPMYTTPKILNAGLAVTREKIHTMSSAVSTIPMMMHASLYGHRGSTAARYMMCPVRNTTMPTRNISCPFSSNTMRRLSRTSAMLPMMSPAAIIAATCVPGLHTSPITTKHSDARPFSTTAFTYSPRLSARRKTRARTAHTINRTIRIPCICGPPFNHSLLSHCQHRAMITTLHKTSRPGTIALTANLYSHFL